MNNQIDIVYLCDRKACVTCHDYCLHTKNREHAIHKDDLNGRTFKYTEYVDRDKSIIGFFEMEEENV